MKSNTQKRKRLVLCRTTIRVLDAGELASATGGNHHSDGGHGASEKCPPPDVGLC